MGAKGSFTWNVTVAVSAVGRAVVVFSEQVFSGKWPQSQLPREGVLCFTPGLCEWCPLVCEHFQGSIILPSS